MLIKYIKSVLWTVAKCLSYIEDARYLKVKIPAVAKIMYRLRYINKVGIDSTGGKLLTGAKQN